MDVDVDVDVMEEERRMNDGGRLCCFIGRRNSRRGHGLQANENCCQTVAILSWKVNVIGEMRNSTISDGKAQTVAPSIVR